MQPGTKQWLESMYSACVPIYRVCAALIVKETGCSPRFQPWQVSSEFYMREVLGINREWGVLAWDVAGKAICYMCLEAVGYLTLVSLSPIGMLFSWEYSKRTASPFYPLLGPTGSD